MLDTNVFLEILLAQEKKEECKKFLNDNIEGLNVTDFSLHSIGVILFRYGRKEVFQKFVEDILDAIRVLSLPIDRYREVVNVSKNLNLDFDDAYQYAVAKYYGLQVVTMDRDFEKVKDVEVLFL